MLVRVVGVAILAAALSGCWVVKELDDGNKKMDAFMHKKPEAEAEETLVAHKGPRVGEYFANQKNARTLTKGQLPTDIVSCKVKEGTQFMKQKDCVNRGGVPGG